MLRWLSPGDLISDAVGLPAGEHRIIFRMFLNTLIWGAILVLAVVLILR